MVIEFFKYHGAGNDFILIDNRKNKSNFLKKSPELIKTMCNRHFGIGADGLMLLNKSEKLAFDMTYFNADGKEGSMCGNGGRCISWFAHYLKIVDLNFIFEAIDGIHQAIIIKKNKDEAIIKLKMQDVLSSDIYENYFVLNTGSPHYVKFVENVNEIDVFYEGKKIRNSKTFEKEGINVNFVETNSNVLKIRTYERGVENETLACGTGATAVALAHSLKTNSSANYAEIHALGGTLTVYYQKYDNYKFNNIWLQGAAKKVFSGYITV